MKAPLLLLHGALGSKNQFNPIKGRLEEHFDVYTLNFEGHGGTPSNHPFSIEVFTENVLQFLEAHSIDSIHIFGYSMGGYVALHTALKFPNKINQIVTLGTKFNWDKEAAQKEVRMLDPAKIEEKVPHFAEKLNQVHHPQDWKTVMKKTAEMMLSIGNGQKLQDKDFKDISVPVTIGIGSLDRMVSLEESAYVSKLLPNATLITLEGVQHPIEKLDTDQLADYVISNLKVSSN